MIQVTLKKKNDLIEMVIVKGHAMYADYGKDIVCSAVSSIVITTVNGIFMIDEKFLTVEQTPDKMIISIQKNDHICFKLMENMMLLLIELSEKYPKNITVK